MTKKAILFSFLGLGITLMGCSQKTQPQKTNSLNSVSFYKAYENYFPIGAAISPALDFASEERKNWIPTQYNSITPENQLKPKFIHPKEDVWSWKPSDEIIEYARANKLKVRGHTLVWFQSTPEWMVKDGDKAASKQLLLSRMKTHIETTMKRYKDDIYCWDVVNEAISNQPNEVFRANDPLHAILGEDYVAQAFIMARAADPKCQLYYNDYRFSDPVKRKKIYGLMKRMKERGVPIDGIGFQEHLVPDEMTEEYFQETIDMFSALGLKIQITELDISVYNFRDEKNPNIDKSDDKYTEARKKKQEEMFDMVFRVCRKNKDKIRGITFWGTTDARNNYRTIRLGKMDYPFIFDEFMKPKPLISRLIDFKN